jgi:hypothetical protein
MLQHLKLFPITYTKVFAVYFHDKAHDQTCASGSRNAEVLNFTSLPVNCTKRGVILDLIGVCIVPNMLLASYPHTHN